MRRKVLVVDDDPYLSTQLRKLLESDELSVDTVASAHEASSTLQSSDIRATLRAYALKRAVAGGKQPSSQRMK